MSSFNHGKTFLPMAMNEWTFARVVTIIHRMVCLSGGFIAFIHCADEHWKMCLNIRKFCDIQLWSIFLFMWWWARNTLALAIKTNIETVTLWMATIGVHDRDDARFGVPLCIFKTVFSYSNMEAFVIRFNTSHEWIMHKKKVKHSGMSICLQAIPNLHYFICLTKTMSVSNCQLNDL